MTISMHGRRNHSPFEASTDTAFTDCLDERAANVVADQFGTRLVSNYVVDDGERIFSTRKVQYQLGSCIEKKVYLQFPTSDHIACDDSETMITDGGKDTRLFKTVKHPFFAIVRVSLPTLYAYCILISLCGSRLSLDVFDNPFFTFYLNHFLP